MTAAGHASPNLGSAFASDGSVRRNANARSAAAQSIAPETSASHSSTSGQSTEKVGNFPPSHHVPVIDVTPDDQTLINECLAGRLNAFDQLIARYQDRLHNSLVRILRSAEDARDVAQEAWIHAYQRLSTFRGNSAFYSWLFRIAYNAAVSERRKARLPTTSIDAAREAAGVEPSDVRVENVPSHAIETSERQRIVRKALDELTEEFRTALVLKEMEGLRYEEIAEMIGCPIGTVRSRIHRARLELHEKLHVLVENGGL